MGGWEALSSGMGVGADRTSRISRACFDGLKISLLSLISSLALLFRSSAGF